LTALFQKYLSTETLVFQAEGKTKQNKTVTSENLGFKGNKPGLNVPHLSAYTEVHNCFLEGVKYHLLNIENTHSLGGILMQTLHFYK